MRIVQVNYAYHPDDTDPDEVLARYATQTRWGQAVLEAGAGGMAVIQGFHRDATLTRNGIEYRLVAREPSLAQAMMDLRPDVVHIHGLGQPRRVWAMRRGLPAEAAVVVQDHGGVSRGIPGPRRLVEWLTYRQGLAGADGFFFTATAVAESWRRARLIQGRQPVYELAETSADLRPLPRDVARVASGIQGSPALLWAGRLDKAADPLTVLDGMARALPGLPQAHLTMVYDSGSLQVQVEARAAQPDLAGRVTLAEAAPQADPTLLYSAADLFVLASRSDSAGAALLDALACGVIPVVTDIQPYRRFTLDGTWGALWPPGDATALAEALRTRAVGDHEAQRQARLDYFATHLSWPALGRAAWAAYQDAHTRRRH